MCTSLFSALSSQTRLHNMQVSHCMCAYTRVQPQFPLKLVSTCIISVTHMIISFFLWMNWSSNIAIQHRDSNIDWENLQVSIHKAGSPFSSDNPTRVGYRHVQEEQQYTGPPNDGVPDRKFLIEVYKVFFPHWIQWPLFPLTPREFPFIML